MSLVGPRPAIPYEVAAYQTWHRRRVLEVKPGITGLWQVTGRSRVKFDEMVRMDLRYAMSWSPWLDIKILLRTPRAVIRGEVRTEFGVCGLSFDSAQYCICSSQEPDSLPPCQCLTQSSEVLKGGETS